MNAATIFYSLAIYHIASGHAFFSGTALILVAALSAIWSRGHRQAVGRAVLEFGGLGLVGVSSTPLPIWVYCVAGVVTLGWIALESSTKTAHWHLTRHLRFAVLAAWSLAIALELPFHLMPTVPRMSASQLYLIGDSLSAGIGGNFETWPKLFARQHHVAVIDLSRSGADVAMAMDQAEQVSGAKSLVLVEIGGNDVLRGYPPETYERGLDALLAKLRDGGRTVIMLELPLPPFCNRYGAAQRRLARKHGVLLVPKRELMGVLTSEAATLDSIHLSARGHVLMAEAIWDVIGDALWPLTARSRHQGRLERRLESTVRRAFAALWLEAHLARPMARSAKVCAGPAINRDRDWPAIDSLQECQVNLPVLGRNRCRARQSRKRADERTLLTHAPERTDRPLGFERDWRPNRLACLVCPVERSRQLDRRACLGRAFGVGRISLMRSRREPREQGHRLERFELGTQAGQFAHDFSFRAG